MAKLSECIACPLHEGRTQVVMPRGDDVTGVMFVGEAPGTDEDRTGTTFVGQSGKFLSVVLADALAKTGLGESEFWITNTVKCRPPDDRLPTQEEIMACSGWLDKEVERARPVLVVALGKTAASRMMPRYNLSKFLGEVGRVHHSSQYGCLVLITYHPSFVLRMEGDAEVIGGFRRHIRWAASVADGPHWHVRALARAIINDADFAINGMPVHEADEAKIMAAARGT